MKNTTFTAGRCFALSIFWFCATFFTVRSASFVPGCESLLDIDLTNLGSSRVSNLPKCYCDRVSNSSNDLVQINCVHLNNLDELNKAVANVSAANKNTAEIHVRGFNLTQKRVDKTVKGQQAAPFDIPDNFFADLLPPKKLASLKEITIKDCLISLGGKNSIQKLTATELSSLLPTVGNQIFKGLEKSLKSLKIVNCPTFDKIFDLIKNLKSLNTLQLSNANVINVKKNDLLGFNDLKSFELSDQNTTIEAGTLGSLKGVEKLKLSKLNLNESILDELKSLTSLKSLDLSENNIRSLPGKSFSFFKQLKKLILNFNYINKLDDNTFDGLNQLDTLDLRVNLIADITQNAFSKLNNLKQLLLAGNYISDLSVPQLKNAGNLEQLDLSHNELRKIGKDLLGPLKKLQKLNLDKNARLSSIDAGSFDSLANLRSLNLSFTNLSNFLTNIGKIVRDNSKTGNTTQANIFKPLSNLVSLDLSNTGLDKIDKSLFADLKKLRNLYLRGNNLENIQADVLPPLSDVQTLDLSDNPWNCDNSLKDLVTFLQKLSNSKESLRSKIQSAMCAFPLNLRGSPLISAKIGS